MLAEGLEVFAGFEANGFAGGDGDFSAGTRIATDAGFAGFDGEDAEAAQFDSVAAAKGVLHGFKYSVHGGLSLGPWKASAFNYPLDKVLLDQWRSPSCTPSH